VAPHVFRRLPRMKLHDEGFANHEISLKSCDKNRFGFNEVRGELTLTVGRRDANRIHAQFLLRRFNSWPPNLSSTKAAERATLGNPFLFL
jgi:hypothetical protein